MFFIILFIMYNGLWETITSHTCLIGIDGCASVSKTEKVGSIPTSDTKKIKKKYSKN